MSSAEVVRSMKIKTSTLSRIHKEYVYYQQETDKEKERVEKMKAESADPHDLRQAVSSLLWLLQQQTCMEPAGAAHQAAACCIFRKTHTNMQALWSVSRVKNDSCTPMLCKLDLCLPL